MLDEPTDVLGYTAGIPLAPTGPSQLGQVFVGRSLRRTQGFGVFVVKLVETEATAVGDLYRFRDGLGIVNEKEPDGVFAPMIVAMASVICTMGF